MVTVNDNLSSLPLAGVMLVGDGSSAVVVFGLSCGAGRRRCGGFCVLIGWLHGWAFVSLLGKTCAPKGIIIDGFPIVAELALTFETWWTFLQRGSEEV